MQQTPTFLIRVHVKLARRTKNRITNFSRTNPLKSTKLCRSHFYVIISQPAEFGTFLFVNSTPSRTPCILRILLLWLLSGYFVTNVIYVFICIWLRLSFTWLRDAQGNRPPPLCGPAREKVFCTLFFRKASNCRVRKQSYFTSSVVTKPISNRGCQISITGPTVHYTKEFESL